MCLTASLAAAEIYSFTDSEGTTHFTDAVPKGDTRYKIDHRGAPAEKPLPKPLAFIYENVADGVMVAARATDKKGYFYWYFGNKDSKILVWVVNKKTVMSTGSMFRFSPEEVICYDSSGAYKQDTWVQGTNGYAMFLATVDYPR